MLLLVDAPPPPGGQNHALEGLCQGLTSQIGVICKGHPRNEFHGWRARKLSLLPEATRSSCASAIGLLLAQHLEPTCRQVMAENRTTVIIDPSGEIAGTALVLLKRITRRRALWSNPPGKGAARKP